MFKMIYIKKNLPEKLKNYSSINNNNIKNIINVITGSQTLFFFFINKNLKVVHLIFIVI